ncbi:MAG: aldo/keto reductase [Chloroflexota bacterium]|nr:aldo/keto reductase [Chloroflexota bacterium]
MRFTSIAGINRPVSRVVLGTEDYFLHQYDHHARILDAWIAGGGTALDTARLYATLDGVPNSELVVGRWLAERGNREQVTIITKGAHPRGGDDSGLGWVSKEVIDNDVLASLEALRTDWIDIWLFHRDNPNVEVAPIMDCINAHIADGRIRAIGASNWTLDRFEEANRYAADNGLQGFSLLSNHFGLATQQAPRWPGCVSLLPDQRRRLIASGRPNLAWSSQCGGFFAGIYDPADRSNEPMVATYYAEENFARLDRARELAAEIGISPMQVALSYTLSQEFDSLGVFWSANERELAETLAAVDLVLSPDQIGFLEGAA